MHYSKDAFISDDGLKLVTHSWEPVDSASTMIVVIHGMGEHGRRYDSFAQFFTKKGFMVVALDLRGHGESAGKRGHSSSFEHVLGDIDAFIKRQDKLFPQMQKVLYGYSMGGNFLLNFLLTRESNVLAAIASAPALKTSYAPAPIKAFFAKLIRLIYPSFTVSSGVNSKALYGVKKVQEDVLALVEKDPLLHNRISVEMALSSIEKGLWALDNACRINIPLLIMHGTSDKVTKHDASEDFIEQVENDLGRLKLYEGLFHNLNDKAYEEMILEDVLTWINEVRY